MYKSCLLLVFAFFSFVTAVTFTNPIKSDNGADPSMLYTAEDGGWYYLVNTGNMWGRMEMMRGRTIDELKKSERNVILDTTWDWLQVSDLWAPEIHQINGTWYLYYTAHEKTASDPNRYRPWVGKAKTASPWDGFDLLQEIDIKPDVWGIDGSVIHFPDDDPNQYYFIWSAACPGFPQCIHIAPMLDPVSLGPSTVISSPQFPWEKNGGAINEGPHALYFKDRVFISFSASLCSDPAYAVGLLTWNGGNPTSPSSWDKLDHPVLTSDNGNFGTGHNGFFRSPNGEELWTVFHASKYSTPDSRACGGDRYTMIEPLTFDDAWNPVFTQAQALSQEQPVPAGDGNPALGPNPLPPQN